MKSDKRQTKNEKQKTKNEVCKGTNGVRSPAEGICQMKNDFGQTHLANEARPSGFPSPAQIRNFGPKILHFWGLKSAIFGPNI